MVLAALRKKGVDAHPFDPKDRDLLDLVRERLRARVHRVARALRRRRHGAGRARVARHPYTGSGVLASALAMDKLRTKRLWAAKGCRPRATRCSTRTATSRPWRSASAAALREAGERRLFRRHDEGAQERRSRGGVRARGELRPRRARREVHRRPGAHRRHPRRAGAAHHPHRDAAREFYDYEAKYIADDTRYLIPCGLPAKKEKELQALSLQAFRALGCRGWGRVDLMLDKRGRPYLLEVNTSPGMTDHSLVPMAARAVGTPTKTCA